MQEKIMINYIKQLVNFILTIDNPKTNNLPQSRFLFR